MPECEAERRIMQTLYEIELMWGNGIIDLGKIRRILSGPEKCPEGAHSKEKAEQYTPK